MWVATPSSQWTFTTYSLPVSRRTHSRRAPPRELVDKGAVTCANGGEVGRKAEVIITMVPDTPDVETVLFGPDGVAGGLSAGKIVVDMSSISPIATKEFAKKVTAHGCEYLDAPVSGGEVGAKAASSHDHGWRPRGRL